MCSGRLAIAALLGIVSALVGIGIMRGVALCEVLLTKTGLWLLLRTALGGFVRRAARSG